MSTFVAFCAVFGLSLAANFEYNGESWKKEFDVVDLAKMDIKSTFADWKLAFERGYSSDQEEYNRFAQWVENVQFISKYNSGDHTAKLRPNQFTDMSSEEFLQYIHGDDGSCLNNVDKGIPILNANAPEMHSEGNPSAVDWAKEGKVTPVKDQGQCGSCWSFSATGSTECNYAIQTGTLNSLSEQELVDCSIKYGNLACNGGQMDAAFKYIKDEGGLCSESEYAYNAKRGSCKKSSCGTHFNPVKSYTDVTKKSESSLESAVAAGCVSVAIEADQQTFQSYSSGVLTSSCGTNLDHGVLVVGYGTDGSNEYWKVKNSWSSSWGEQGYIRLCKNCNANSKDGECGINDDPSYPTF